MLKFHIHTSNFNSQPASLARLLRAAAAAAAVPCEEETISSALERRAYSPGVYTGQQYCQFTSVSWVMVESTYIVCLPEYNFEVLYVSISIYSTTIQR